MADLKSITQHFRFSSNSKPGEFEPEAEFMSRLMETVDALIVVLDEQGRVVEFNCASERLSGYSRSEVLGKKPNFLIPPEERAGVSEVIQNLLTDKRASHYENHWLTKAGKKRLLLWTNSSVKNKEGQIKSIICSGIDITKIREREERRLVILEMLETLASPGDQDTVLAQIIEIVRGYLKCDAVGIRLRKGDDYPYVQAMGFDETFLKKESMLCSFEGSTINKDENGVALLECMCGRVIRGDLMDTIASEEGAFLTGNINELVAKAAKKDLPFKIRNHCGQAGYLSVALIPLRFNNETVGLLQLNDHQADHFSDEDVNFFSIAGQSIGTALVRFQAEQGKKKTELILNTIIQKARDGFFLGTPDGKTIIYNEAMERITGYSQEEVNVHGWFYLVFPNEKERRQSIHKARQA
ncbi:MAG: PAS domain S-box protein, partial [Firmicutes bacterium]|nr:PAS domain S-box protein [Bacillota bacterium]